MKLEEYIEKYDIGYAHDGYCCGEGSFTDIEELLGYLKENEIRCPEYVQGLVRVSIIIDPECMVDDIEETLCNDEYAGENYEMPEAGKEYLKKCFEEYNDKYANNGNYCDVVNVEVPLEMSYELEVPNGN